MKESKKRNTKPRDERGEETANRKARARADEGKATARRGKKFNVGGTRW